MATDPALCKHDTRDAIDEATDLHRCTRCGCIMKGDVVFYTPVEEAPWTTEERDFKHEYYVLRGENQRLEAALKERQLMEELWQGTAEKLYTILGNNLDKVRAIKSRQVIPGQTTVDDMFPTEEGGEAT